MTPTKRQPLFVISGASGVGKSTTCELLFRQERQYLVLESDLLWEDRYDTPQDNYRAFRTVWMQVCANVAQIGMPVVLCGCGIPEQFEQREERSLFTEIHYLALVCSEETLEQRMRAGRQIAAESWLKSSRDFNRWLRENGGQTRPPMALLDTTCLTPEQAARRVDAWIRSHMSKSPEHP